MTRTRARVAPGVAILIFVLVSLVAGMSAVPAAEAPSPSELEQLMARARVVQDADTAAWGRLAFHRHAVGEKLDSNGAVLEKEDLEFQLKPTGDGFDELLLRINGRDPSQREVDQHRAKARFSHRYAKMRAGEGEDEEMGYSMGLLLKMSKSTYAGRETIGGRDCHRIEFAGDPEVAQSGLAGRVAAAMSGTIWLDVEGLHLVRAIAKSTKPVSAFMAIAKVSELAVSLDSVSAPGGAWVPERIRMSTAGYVLGHRFSRRYLYEYSNFSTP